MKTKWETNISYFCIFQINSNSLFPYLSQIFQKFILIIHSLNEIILHINFFKKKILPFYRISSKKLLLQNSFLTKGAQTNLIYQKKMGPIDSSSPLKSKVCLLVHQGVRLTPQCTDLLTRVSSRFFFIHCKPPLVRWYVLTPQYTNRKTLKSISTTLFLPQVQQVY